MAKLKINPKHEEIFETEMKKESPNFQLKYFKTSNPKIYMAIMKSMDEIENQRNE